MHVLYLEDSDPDIDIIRRYVGSYSGLRFTSAKTTADALAVLHSENPDVFLVDIMINGQPAFPIIKTSVSQKLARYVIAMTARALPSEVTYYEELGCSHVIAKPFTMDILDRVFNQLI